MINFLRTAISPKLAYFEANGQVNVCINNLKKNGRISGHFYKA